MVYIDFQGGTHGNYLEFVCNKFLANVPTDGTPFNSVGASHNKVYLEQKKFNAWHYFEYCGCRTTPDHGQIISITIEPDDLLPLLAVSLMRAGNFGLDNNKLEIDTYNKLNQPHYRWVLDNLISSFFKGQVAESYNAIKDPSWPNVDTIDNFLQLPDAIKKECVEQHNLQLLELSKDRPNCPRWILREFFKIGFKNPSIAGFITQQNKMFYSDTVDVYKFPYCSFYYIDRFVDQINRLAQWIGTPVDSIDTEELKKLHNQFLEKQPYKHYKIYCDDIVQRIIANEQFDLPMLDLLQESYISSQLELHYHKELTTQHWFETSAEIIEYFK